MDEQRARQLIGREQERVERLIQDVREGGLTGPEGEEISELAHYDQHQADVATEMFEREKDLSILESLEGQMADLEDALRRVDEGTYGVCEVCGEPILEERMEAVPTARFCTRDEPER